MEMLQESDLSYYYCDAQRRFYQVRDVAALGDCAVLAVLCHPNFTAPLSDVQELRCAVVSFFPQGPRSAECKHVFTVLKNIADTTFEVFLESVLKPRFWVGT
jgi:hypothetical protein